MKHLIKIESVAHGVLGMKHAGLDQQYCEAGELVILKWQPDAGWGLQEAHYTDGDGNVTAIEGGSFTMPNKDITIGGTFKRFSAGDWETEGEAGNVMVTDANGSPSATDKVDINNYGDIYTQGLVYAEGPISSEDYISAEGDIHVNGQYGIIFHTQDGNYSLTIDNGQLRVDPYNQ